MEYHHMQATMLYRQTDAYKDLDLLQTYTFQVPEAESLTEEVYKGLISWFVHLHLLAINH